MYTKLLTLYCKDSLASIRCVSTTPLQYLNQKWRQERGLPLQPNSCGVLTDTPDYTFLDGRPTPYGIGQKERIIKQKEIADKVIALTKEMDFAVDRHQKLVDEKRKTREAIISNKLKPKGEALLKKKDK